MEKEAESSGLIESTELRRVIGFWGLFSMGYADVGADVFIALGVVVVVAGVMAPFALAVAATAYVAVCLAYAELSFKYPHAGGASYFAKKAFGSLHGFLAGWFLTFAYVTDISLFALTSAAYFQKLLVSLGLGWIDTVQYLGIITSVLILFLLAINYVGIKESSRLNEVFTALGLVTLSALIVVGAFAVWEAFKLGISWMNAWSVDPYTFFYATALSFCSFIGVSSIAQAAEEAKEVGKIVKAFIITGLAVVGIAEGLLISMALSIPAQSISENVHRALFLLAEKAPFVGKWLSYWVCFSAFTICLVSANTGVIGASRVLYGMRREGLAPYFLGKVHKKRKTPYIAIILFSVIAIAIVLLNTLGGILDLEAMIAIYNFGALLTHAYVMLSHIALREEGASWKSPVSVRLGDREIPLTSVIGLVLCALIIAALFSRKIIGLAYGLTWTAAGLFMYWVMRWKSRS